MLDWSSSERTWFLLSFNSRPSIPPRFGTDPNNCLIISHIPPQMWEQVLLTSETSSSEHLVGIRRCQLLRHDIADADMQASPQRYTGSGIELKPSHYIFNQTTIINSMQKSSWQCLRVRNEEAARQQHKDSRLNPAVHSQIHTAFTHVLMILTSSPYLSHLSIGLHKSFQCMSREAPNTINLEQTILRTPIQPPKLSTLTPRQP